LDAPPPLLFSHKIDRGDGIPSGTDKPAASTHPKRYFLRLQQMLEMFSVVYAVLVVDWTVFKSSTDYNQFLFNFNLRNS
jgi:hypothetical protein